MTEDKRPVQLEYKTPEKRERANAFVVTWAVIFGVFAGIFTVKAFAFTFIAIDAFTHSAGLYQVILFVLVALFGWMMTFVFLRQAIRTIRKPRNSQPESPN